MDNMVCPEFVPRIGIYHPLSYRRQRQENPRKLGTSRLASLYIQQQKKTEVGLQAGWKVRTATCGYLLTTVYIYTNRRGGDGGRTELITIQMVRLYGATEIVQ